MTDAYTSYLAAKHCGWEVLRAFHTANKNLQPDAIAQRDGIPVAEVKLLRRTYERLKPCAQEAAGHSLDMLQLVGRMISKVKENTVEVLARMLRECAGLSLRAAEFRLKDIVGETHQRRARTNRMNFGKNSDEDDMVRLIGIIKAEHARAIQSRAEKDIKVAMAKNPGLRYDIALGNWMVNKLLSQPAAGAEEPQVTHQPMIILAGDPNIDARRGHLNTLAGASLPLADAINTRLAGTGYVALTRLDDNGVVHLDAIVPIVRERMSTGLHRVGVILENLVCAHPACDLPALYCQAHNIYSVAYHGGETSWENLAAMCTPHNAQNDDNPNAPPRNGAMRRDKKGWVGHEPYPGAPMTYNPNPKFREGYRGTAEEMAENFRATP